MSWENYAKSLDSNSDFDIEIGGALMTSASQAIDQYNNGLISGHELLSLLRWAVNDIDIKVLEYNEQFASVIGPANQELHPTDRD